MCTLVQVPDVAVPAVHPATPPFYNPPPPHPSQATWHVPSDGIPNYQTAGMPRRQLGGGASVVLGCVVAWFKTYADPGPHPLEPARLSLRCTPYIPPHGGSAARHAIHRTAHTGAAAPVASRGQKRYCERAKIAFAVQTEIRCGVGCASLGQRRVHRQRQGCLRAQLCRPRHSYGQIFIA